jgi:hypothetical protein
LPVLFINPLLYLSTGGIICPDLPLAEGFYKWRSGGEIGGHNRQ